MNSQFKNSSFGFYLYASIIVIIAAASIFVFWYMVKGYKLGTYPEDTILGSVYLGGIREDEVIPKLEDRIERWRSDETIVFEVTYQGYSYQFDRELFYFDLTTSMFYLDNGETNDLVVTFQGNDRIDVINEINGLLFLEDIESNFNIEALITDILADAAYMKSFSSKRIEDYIVDDTIAYVSIYSVSVNIPEGISIDQLILKIDSVYDDSRIVVPNKDLYDIVESLGSVLSDSEMTVLSTGMFDLILKTNFAVNEVHYVPAIDYNIYDLSTFPSFGHNASINQIIGDSFSFYNPNDSDYYFVLTKVSDVKATLSLVGLDFVDTISVSIDENIIEYITQTTDNDTILQLGYDGMIIEVTRTITNIYGVVTYEKVIVFEFYPPIKAIILE